MKNVLLCFVLFCTTSLFANTIPDRESNNTLVAYFYVDNIRYTPTSLTEVSVTGNSILTLSDVIIPSTVSNGVTTYSVTSIGILSFNYCNLLKSISLPSGITSIGDSAFYRCTSLTSISIPNNVTSISDYAFYRCTSLTSISLPNSLTSIGISVFAYCWGLTSISLPNSLTSTGSSVFAYCSSLTSISLPNSLTSIGYYAFRNCTSLTSITLPNSLTSIEGSMFNSCTSLTNITIPSGVTSIGSLAFNGCTSLTNITIPSGVTSIGISAFNGCASFTSITIPIGVTSIGSSAFFGCTGLTSFNLPIGLTSIGNLAFKNCTSLVSFTINAASPPVIISNVFDGVTVASVNLYVPSGSKTDYKIASVWSGFKFPPYITAPGASTTSTSSLTMNENSTAVTTFTADEIVTWSLGASHDEGLFSIDSSGVLVFTNAPDYETPVGTLHNNTYIVEVKATGTNSVTTFQQLTITITDVVVEVFSSTVLSDFNSFTVSSATSDFTINAPSSNSSGAITYTSSNTGVATITGTTVHLVGPGTTTISAIQAANGSYLGNSISARMSVNALCGDWGYVLHPPITY